MAHSSQASPTEPRPADDEPARDEYGELRQLLLQPEQEEIDALRRQLAHTRPAPESVAAVLPAAFTMASEGDKAMSAAMLPLVEGSIAQSVKQHPEVIAEAIFPIIGTAISRAVREAFLRMMQQTTYAMENAFSLRSWRWRLEARATGKSFSEVVLLHSLIYRVEQVFLIQPESGLLLQHVYADFLDGTPGSEVPDATMVSSMLTAIQAFVRDSFRVESKAALDSIEVGELTVWIERGPQAVLAGVIRGTAPMNIRQVFRTALESCHRDLKKELKHFSGNPDDLKVTRPYLESCLKSQKQAPPKKSIMPRVVMTLLGLGLLGLAGGGLWIQYQRSTHFSRSLENLRRQPGIVVVSAERDGKKARLVVLRDPDAGAESEFIARAGFLPHNTQVSWKTFVAGDAEIVMRRATQALRPTSDVTLTYDAGTLTATGSATEDWIYDAKLVAQVVPGVRAFNCAVTPLPRPPDLYEVLSARARKIEDIEIRFRAGSIELMPGQDAGIARAVAEMRELLRIAAEDKGGMQITIEIHAYTDDIGNELYNLKLRESRAKIMHHWLASAGVDERHLRAVAPLEFERERSARAAGFRIVITAGAGDKARARGNSR